MSIIEDKDAIPASLGADVNKDHSAATERLSVRTRRTLAGLAVAGVVMPTMVLAALALPHGALLTIREMWFLVHLMLGVLIVHAFAGGLAGLMLRRPTKAGEIMRITSTVGLATVSWLAVLSGTWLVYPGYRAAPAEGADLANYPRAYLQENGLGFWHEVAFEWKEHVGWVTPVLATAVAYVAYRHGELLRRDPRLKAVTMTMFVVAFAAAVVAAGIGAAVNAVAPNGFLDLD